MNNGAKYKFSGHETFVFRYGWLEKGVQAVNDCPDIFTRDDAIVRLGVGKNMVSSIRHWCQVAQLIEMDPESNGNSGRFRVTDIGKQLLLDNGWDRFLEDDASLWLIHWLIVTNPNLITASQLLFSGFHRPDFTKRELMEYFYLLIKKESLKISDTVINRDIDCLLRTYSLYNRNRLECLEETFNCPLLQLDLIQSSPDGDLYKFSIGPKPSLPVAIFTYALIQYWDRTRGNSNTLSVQECLYGPGSPGQAFKLDENSMVGYIEELDDHTHGLITLDETAGLKQIYRKRGFEPIEVLSEYYQGRRNN